MAKKKFKAQSERLMELMINSIYTNKDIFLRELISNASDASDKMYYRALSDDGIKFDKDEYIIRIERDEENRILKIIDNGIGMTKDELENNLGTIAKSGSLDFKKDLTSDEEHEIIGQFGVGFYSAFMVSKKVEVRSLALNEKTSYKWVSDGVKGYEILEDDKENRGTEVILYLRDGEDYDKYLDRFEIYDLVKKYSNFIRYPIKMLVEKQRPLDEPTDDNKYETYKEDETLNSMVPIWRKQKSELKEEDYINFYQRRRFGYDEPLVHLHMNLEGALSFKSILFIPKNKPWDFYSTDYKGGLELYSKSVMIMEKCEELLPKYLGFVKGVVDSEDISLNISRETLQHSRELITMKNKIEGRILKELKKLMEDREKYSEFFDNFGIMLKGGIYESFGQMSDKLKDLLIFDSTKRKNISFNEYIKDIKEDQKFIYYAVGKDVDAIKELPQIKSLMDDDIEVLCFSDYLDEFVAKVMRSYDDYEFKSISESEKQGEDKKDNKIIDKMKEILGDEVFDIRENENLKNDASYLSSEGEISIDMEKTLSQMPGNEGIKAKKILEINPNHNAFKELIGADGDKLRLYTELLYDQARLISGLKIDDPIKFARNISKLM